MPRVSNKAVLADRFNPAQPALFDDSQLPVCLPVLESIKTRSYEHQGVRLMEDDTKALRLVELLTMKWGVKKISAEMQISPHTVRAARRALVIQGKLAPYKQRVVEAMEDAIEAGVGNYRDALEGNFVPAAQIPVGVAIMADKRALAMGEPTHISGRGEVQEADLKVEDLNRYFEQMPSCKATDIDSQSIGKPTKGQQTQGSAAQDVTLDVSQGGPSPDSETPGSATRASGPASVGSAAAGNGGDPAATAEGGGGDAARAAAD